MNPSFRRMALGARSNRTGGGGGCTGPQSADGQGDHHTDATGKQELRDAEIDALCGWISKAAGDRVSMHDFNAAVLHLLLAFERRG